MKISRKVVYPVFFLIVGLLIFISPTNLISGGEDHFRKTSLVKFNMHTLQKAVETYANNNAGKYPENLSVLIKEAVKKGYWKELKNPFNKKTGKDINGSCNDISDSEISKLVYDTPSDFFKEGVVGYKSDKTFLTYCIYGVGKDSKPITDNKGKIFYLSNQ